MFDALAPLQLYGLAALGGTVVLLFVFLGLRGRVPIDRGWGGMTIERFSAFERASHWVLALSFLVLAATGLATTFAPVIGTRFGIWGMSTLTASGRVLHNSAAFVFVFVLSVAFLVWLRHSLPHWRDAVWLSRAGGMMAKNTTPAAGMFNAGQKILFWALMLGGLGLIVTGAALLSPYRSGLASKTFGVLASMGVQPATGTTNLTPAQEMHYARLWHGALAIGLTCVVIAHIYMRTFGIRGALPAMTSGQVDVNLARQHNGLWAETKLQRMQEDLRAAPAE